LGHVCPVVRWMSVKMMLVLTLADKVQSGSIDFTLAYPQADLDVDIYLELPRLDGHGRQEETICTQAALEYKPASTGTRN
jgi:hypothetical protein